MLSAAVAGSLFEIFPTAMQHTVNQRNDLDNESIGQVYFWLMRHLHRLNLPRLQLIRIVVNHLIYIS